MTSTDPDEIENLDENAAEEDIAPPKKKFRKSSAGQRTISHQWTHDQVSALIKAVEKRRGLWDAGSGAYKLSKLDGWREVCEELDLPIDAKEVKAKWASLRVSFKVNLANYRKKRSGQGADEVGVVAWRYFQAMLFLEANDITQATPSTSTMDLASAVDDQCVLSELMASPEPKTTRATVGQRQKRRIFSGTPTPSSSPAPSANSSSVALDKALAVLETNDTNSTFCCHICSELRDLPEETAIRLRLLLNRAMCNFLEEYYSRQREEQELLNSAEYLVEYL